MKDENKVRQTLNDSHFGIRGDGIAEEGYQYQSRVPMPQSIKLDPTEVSTPVGPYAGPVRDACKDKCINNIKRILDDIGHFPATIRNNGLKRWQCRAPPSVRYAS